MSLSLKIREQLIASFRVELAEHVQTMTDGLLALEQGRVEGQERQSTLEDIFRAAHSLKGASRAVGVTVTEQLAHSLEGVLDALQNDTVEPTSELFTVCYQALDAIQAVQANYEAGETTPPMQAIEALADLEPFRSVSRGAPQASRASRGSSLTRRRAAAKPKAERPAPEPKAQEPTPEPAPKSARLPQPKAPPLGAALHEQLRGAWEASVEKTTEHGETGTPQTVESTDATPDVVQSTPASETPVSPRSSLDPSSNGTIRVSVSKLDALMNQLNELLATKIRAEQQLVQMRHLQELVIEWEKEWLLVRSVYNRLARQEKNGLLNAHRLKSIDALRGGVFGYAEEGSVRTEFASQAELALLGGALGVPRVDGGGSGTVLRELGKDVSQLLDYVGTSQDQLQEINALINDMSRQYASDTAYMSLVIDELEKEIKRVRMLPLSTATGTFGRMVRDLAQAAGKEVVLEIAGGDTELDKQVLEQIKDPLVHLLRNAVDHGVELPSYRERVGKPRAGTITLSAEQLDKNILIRVSDDGSGLNYDAIRNSIARRGVPDVDSLKEADLKEAIFQSGVSTSPIITDISGRGVGLDVVRKNVEALRGTVDVSARPGEGTTFTLTLPLRLASSRGLLVRAGGETFAIPLHNILKIDSFSPDEIISLEGHDTILYNGEPLTLVPLSEVLELPSQLQAEARKEAQVLVVIVAATERKMAFAVDALVGEQEMVIKALGKQLARVGGVAGATVLGNREVVLVLNVTDLIKLAMRSRRRSVLDTLTEAEPLLTKRAQRQILVVDDSITTRTLEKNILEAAGYVVRLATDGQEALSDITSTGVPDLIVSDVAMPRMNGFELTRRIKKDEHMGNTPVILVTSLDSDEDKARGIEVGADAYIVKSSFDQDNLLETIEQLI